MRTQISPLLDNLEYTQENPLTNWVDTFTGGDKRTSSQKREEEFITDKISESGANLPYSVPRGTVDLSSTTPPVRGT